MSNFLRLLIEFLPLAFLLLVYLLLLGILKRKLQGFYLQFLRFFHVLWIVGQNFQILWNFEFIKIFKSDLLLLLILVLHRPQSQQLNYLLHVVLFVPNVVSVFIYFFNNAGIKLSILRINSLAMCTLLEKRSIGQLQNFQVKCREIFRLALSVAQNLRCLLFNVDFKHLGIFPLSILFQKAFGQILLIRSSQQLLAQRVQVMLFFQIFQCSLFFFQSYVYFLFNLSQLLLLLLLSLGKIQHEIDFHLILLELND